MAVDGSSCRGTGQGPHWPSPKPLWTGVPTVATQARGLRQSRRSGRRRPRRRALRPAGSSSSGVGRRSCMTPARAALNHRSAQRRKSRMRELIPEKGSRRAGINIRPRFAANARSPIDHRKVRFSARSASSTSRPTMPPTPDTPTWGWPSMRGCSSRSIRTAEHRRLPAVPHVMFCGTDCCCRTSGPRRRGQIGRSTRGHAPSISGQRARGASSGSRAGHGASAGLRLEWPFGQL
jgi:hypothetical protein